MIVCPACGHQNIEGVDYCKECLADLFFVGLPENSAEGLGQRLLTDSVLELDPQLRVQVLPEDSVAEVVRTMCDDKASGVMVVFRSALVGVFTERDFLMKIADRYEELKDEPIRKFMTPDPRSVTVKDTIAYGLNQMAVLGYRHIPVVQDDKPIAMVRTRDVLGYIARRVPEVHA